MLRTVWVAVLYISAISLLNSSHQQWCIIVKIETIHVHLQWRSRVISHSSATIWTSMNITKSITCKRLHGEWASGLEFNKQPIKGCVMATSTLHTLLYDWFSMINRALVLKSYTSRVTIPEALHKWHKKTLSLITFSKRIFSEALHWVSRKYLVPATFSTASLCLPVHPISRSSLPTSVYHIMTSIMTSYWGHGHLN